MKTKRILRMSLVIICVAVLFCGCKNTIQAMRKETEKDLSINVTYSGVVKQSEMDTFLTPNVYPRAEDQKAVFFTFHFDNQTDISFSNFDLQDIQTDEVYIDHAFVYSEGPCRIEAGQKKDVQVFAYVNKNMTDVDLEKWAGWHTFTYTFWVDQTDQSIRLKYIGTGTPVRE